jgi:predicted lipoprotein
MKFLILSSIFFMAAFLVGCGQKDSSVGFVENISKNIIEKNYRELYQHANTLVNATLACNKKEANHQHVIEGLKPIWGDVMSSWQRVQWVQFGPIKEDGREWALQFWPDKRNLVGKKINALMQDGSVISDASLSRSGLVAQGLSAMEYLLFDKASQKFSNDALHSDVNFLHVCMSSIAISKAIYKTSKALLDGWVEYDNDNLSDFENPSERSKIVDAQQAISIIVNNIVVMAEVMANRKIGSPFYLNKTSVDIDERVKKSNPFFLESWRSERSRLNLKNNIEALQEILLSGGLDELLDKNSANNFSITLEIQIAKILSMVNLSEIQPSYFKQLSVDKLAAIDNIQSLYKELNVLQKMMAIDLSKALNVQLGFNANDGDS